MFKIRPSLLITFSFLAVIFVGAVILSLPISSATGQFTNFLDAYFTSNSATCVTGLTSLDTGTHFSLFGKIVIMMLIQVGGLGYMTFSIFMVLLFRKKMFVTEKIMMQEMLNIYSMKDVLNVLRRIFSIVFLIEGIGAFILFLRWIPELGFVKAAFWGVFHSVSAFCNAGFALPNNFANLSAYRTDPVINLTITSLIILGGLGFFVIADILQNRRLSLQSKVVIWTSLFLISIGTVIVFIAEYANPATLGNLGLGGKILASYFASVTARTAGFNTIDFGSMLHPSLIAIIVLMFIGASPGGTGGGIKTTTFTLIMATIWAALHNSKDTVLVERRIPPDTVRKAFAIFFLSIVAVFTAISILNYTDTFSVMQITFETVSAFGTVGLSTGITPFLSDWGKIVIISIMFIGRVGAMSLLIGLSSESKKRNIRYPKEGVSIG